MFNPNNVIVAVDNSSLNNSWYNDANQLNINVLYNNSLLHRFEMGAYKMALEHYCADKYIFIQGTIFINNKLNLSQLDTNEEIAIGFEVLFNNLSWSIDGLNLINQMLTSINMNWNNDPVILWNCFCCNNIFINNMLNSGLFDIITNTKEHSCAFERILGVYFQKKMKNINCIESNSFRKIWLCQDIVKI